EVDGVAVVRGNLEVRAWPALVDEHPGGRPSTVGAARGERRLRGGAAPDQVRPVLGGEPDRVWVRVAGGPRYVRLHVSVGAPGPDVARQKRGSRVHHRPAVAGVERGDPPVRFDQQSGVAVVVVLAGAELPPGRRVVLATDPGPGGPARADRRDHDVPLPVHPSDEYAAARVHGAGVGEPAPPGVPERERRGPRRRAAAGTARRAGRDGERQQGDAGGGKRPPPHTPATATSWPASRG